MRRARLFFFSTLALSTLVIGSYVSKSTSRSFRYQELSQETSYWGYYNYAILAEAFRAGQLSLLEKPSPDLIALPNPYRPWLRAKVPYLWDASLYRGKYFLYYSPVPVLVFFLPYHFIRGFYPSQALVLDLMFLFTFILTAWAVFLFYRDRMKENLILWSALLLLLGTANGSRIALDNPTWYTLAIGSGAMWVAAYLFFCARIFKEGATLGRCLGAGLSLVLALWSRPHLGILGIILIGLGIFRYRQRRVVAYKPVAACLSILLLGATVIGTYNFLRFDNVSEFGIRYLLSARDFSTDFLPTQPLVLLEREVKTLPLILFQLPEWAKNPKRLVTTRVKPPILPPQGERLYQDPNVGIFVLCPFLILFGVAFAPSLLKRALREPVVLFGYGSLFSALLITLFLGNTGCTAARYAIDILPASLMGTVILLLEYTRVQTKRVRFWIETLTVCLCIVSVWINFQF